MLGLVRRYDGFPDSTIGSPGLATNEAEVFRLRDFATWRLTVV
jgi:hypothetical protein